MRYLTKIVRIPYSNKKSKIAAEQTFQMIESIEGAKVEELDAPKLIALAMSKLPKCVQKIVGAK